MAQPDKGSKDSRGFTFDRIASLFAVALSMIALLVSLIEVNTSRAQQRAAVWPHMEVVQSYGQEGYELSIVNKGVGPALMGNVVLLNDGVPVQNLDQLILDTVGAENAFSYERYRSSNPSNRVMASGETTTLFGVGWDPVTRELVSAVSETIDVQTCYCSISKDCWSVSYKTRETKSVSRCETSYAP